MNGPPPLYSFTARVGRRGGREHQGRLIPTVILHDLSMAGADGLVRDHTWVDAGEWSIGLYDGNEITFCAELRQYSKTDPGSGLVEWELGLSAVQRVQLVRAVPKNQDSS